MNYAATAAQAAAKIKKYGQPIIITRTSDGTGEFDPTTGAYKETEPQLFHGYALAASSGSSIAANFFQSLMNGTLIKQGDITFTVAASGLGCEPMASDTLTDASGTVWSIVGVDAVAPGGVALLYKVQGRK